MHEVIEPPDVRRATRIMFVLFAGAGIFATVAIMASGEGIFAALFGAMFIGIPWIIHKASMGPGVPGFTLSSDGILGAADDEQRLIPWGEVDNLAWRGTGLEINGRPCLALHAELVDGRSVRVTTYTARRGREVDEIEVQVQATGLLPTGVGFDQGRSRSVPLPTSDAGTSSPKNWSDLPTGMKVFLALFFLAFLAPFLAFFAIIPVLVIAFGGVIGWLLVAAAIAVVAAGIVRVALRGHVPVLACSFTVEGVVADQGDGLTIPWRDGVSLHVESTIADDGPLVEGGKGQGWVVRLRQPEANPVDLSATLTSRFGVQRAVGELTSAKRQGLVPTHVPLTFAPDLPGEVTRKLTAQWEGSGP